MVTGFQRRKSTIIFLVGIRHNDKKTLIYGLKEKIKMKKVMIRMGLIILLALLISGGIWLAMEFNNKNLEIKDMRAGLALERAIKSNLQRKLSFTQRELDKIREELDTTQKQLNEVNSKLVASETNNAKLVSEKRTLEARLHSLKELKKAIRQVKIEMYNERQQQSLAKRQLRKEIDATKLLTGNRGLLCKDGKSTYKPIVKIEVHPGD